MARLTGILMPPTRGWQRTKTLLTALANAKVVATVGEQSFSTDADAQGRYSLPIRSSRASDFVTLTATGMGVQSRVVLTSLAGEVSGLLAAVKNETVTAEDRPALMVTHLSAAQAGHGRASGDSLARC